jgi:NAD(P)H dehydrogenase (quinone)
MAKIHVVFYSMYGHVWEMARAVAEGAGQIDGVQVDMFQVEELVPEDKLRASGAWEARQEFADLPVYTPEDFAEADGFLFGTPTRFGNMCAQMRQLFDRTSGQWMDGTLIGKVGSVFCSTASQHGGQETTITSFHNTLIHHGMVIVGCPYSEQRLLEMGEITGGTPYGATTMAGSDGSRRPSENELAIARFQGRHVAEITQKLHG